MIRLTLVIYNHELRSFQDCISSCALRYVDIYIYITWQILHALSKKKYIILWRVNYQMWQCQLHVWTLSVLIKYFASYLISRGLTSAYDNSYTCNNYNNYTPMPSSSTTAQVNSTKYHSINKTQIDVIIQNISSTTKIQYKHFYRQQFQL